MDDIAWLSWRTTQHGFTHFPDRIRVYEELSGISVDEARVRYYPLPAFGRLGPSFGLADMGHRRAMGLDSGEPPTLHRPADGSALLPPTLHPPSRTAPPRHSMTPPPPSPDVE